ncbi:MAG: ABC transporter permease subunit [Verrucomicrobiota bacterium]
MTFLPVVERELRVASRRGWTYWGRSLTAALALAVATWITWFAGHQAPAQLGIELFVVSSGLAFAFAAFAGVTFSSDAIAAERREGTLGLLFLTDLRGHDVALGKLSASSLDCVFCLLAALPVLALSLLAGGVTFPEYLRMVLVLLVTLFFSLAAGLLASTLATDSRRASGTAVLLTLALGAGIPGLGGLVWLAADRLQLPLAKRPELFERWFLWACPATAFASAFDAGYRAHPLRFAAAVGYSGVTGMLCLAAASLRLPRIWQERARSSPRPGLRRWFFAAPGPGHRARLLAESPLVWLDRRHRLRVLGPWFFLGLSGALFAGLALAFGRDWLDAPGYLATSLFLHLGLKTSLASESPRQFHEDRRSGAMELLLATPLTTPDFLDGRARALRRRFLGPLGVVLAADVLFFLGSGARTSPESEDEWLAFWLARMLLLPLDAYALAWTGMWVGLRTRGSRSTGQVFARVLTLPWLVLAAFMTLLAVLQIPLLGSLFDQWGFKAFVAVWFGLGTVIDIHWIARSQADLNAHFRELAAQPPGVRPTAPAIPA